MLFVKSNLRFPNFEKLETRWLLAADSPCEVALEATAPNLEVVAQTPASAEADVHCLEDHPDSNAAGTETEVPRDDNPSDHTGDEEFAPQDIGGEGESTFVPNEPPDVTPAREAALLTQSPDFNNPERLARNGGIDATFASTEIGMPPSDALRLNNNFVREVQDASKPFSDPANALRTPRPDSPVSNQMTGETTPVASNRIMDDVLASIDRDTAAPTQGAQSNLAFDGHSARAGGRGEHADALPPATIARDVDLAWLPTDVIEGSENQRAKEHSDVDAALMGYLRTLQWPLVPLVAGLAYAITRSVDREVETPEPQLMAMRQRRSTRKNAEH